MAFINEIKSILLPNPRGVKFTLACVGNAWKSPDSHQEVSYHTPLLIILKDYILPCVILTGHLWYALLIAWCMSQCYVCYIRDMVSNLQRNDQQLSACRWSAHRRAASHTLFFFFSDFVCETWKATSWTWDELLNIVSLTDSLDFLVTRTTKSRNYAFTEFQPWHFLTLSYLTRVLNIIFTLTLILYNVYCIHVHANF